MVKRRRKAAEIKEGVRCDERRREEREEEGGWREKNWWKIQLEIITNI